MPIQYLFPLILVVASVSIGYAEPGAGRTSLGVSIADPIGLSARHWVNSTTSIQAVAGWRVLDTGDQNKGLDFPGPIFVIDLTHNFRFGNLSFHTGLGAGVGTVAVGCYVDSISEYCVDETEALLLLRAPIGMALYLDSLGTEFYVEVVPALRITPSLYPTFLGGFGGRYYLPK